jgi:hypothetical protein
MAQHPHLFDIDSLTEARVEFVQEARALPPGGERNQKLQIARSLKRPIEAQGRARTCSLRLVSTRSMGHGRQIGNAELR